MTAALSASQSEQLLAFSRVAAESAANADFDVAWANFALRELARRDLSLACLAWRQATNAVRLASFDMRGPEEALRPMLDGQLVASAFAPARIIASTAARDEIVVIANSVMATGARYAASLVLDATLDGQRSALLAPATVISQVVRPPMVGLAAADNALISLEGRLGCSAVLGQAGDASAVISLPYRIGLTMGSVALGGADRLIGMLRDHVEPKHATELSVLLARHAAAVALMDAAPADPTGRASHATKLAATSVAAELVAYARALFGARAYAASHPLNDLERDLAGIAYQAPTNDGAAAKLLATLLPSGEL